MATTNRNRRDRIVELAALVAATAMLVLVVSAALDGWRASRPDAVLADYAVTITPDGDRAPRIDAVLTDGEAAADATSLGISGWRVDPSLPADFTPRLMPDSTGVAHRLEFRASNPVLLLAPFGWQGVVMVTRNGTPITTHTISGYPSQVVVSGQPAPPRVLPLGLALLLATMITVLFRPWRDEQHRLAWLAVVLSAIHLAFWACQPIGIGSDSTGFLTGVTDIGRGQPAYFPPGYAIFLASLGAAANPWLGGTVTLVQHAMVVAMALWCYRLVRPHAGIGPALVAGVTIGMMPSMLAMSQAVMTEIPTAFLMLGTITCATVARDDPRLRWPLLIGILAGLAVLIRVVPLVALLPAVGLLLLLPWRKRQARLALRSGLVTMAVVCLPLGWFLVRSGTVRLANSTGLHLYNRVVFTQHLLDGTGGATRALVKRLEGADPRTMAFWDVRKFPGIESLGYAGAERLLGAVAMEGIRNAPVAFLAYSPQVGWDEIRRTPFWDIPRWTDTQTEGAATLESHRPLPATAAWYTTRLRLEDLQAASWPILLGLSGLGLVLGFGSGHRRGVLALGWIVGSYLLASASLDIMLNRHAIDVTPFLVLLAVVPLGWLTGGVVRPWVSRRSP